MCKKGFVRQNRHGTGDCVPAISCAYQNDVACALVQCPEGHGCVQGACVPMCILTGQPC